ncbi:MAG TPA: Do family serine endopeptidase [Thermoanaerobaculia bacterium]|nr:Do family serine endopeptidase [Thermoanaerobaculia bacterium]
MTQTVKRNLSITAIIVASVAAGMVLTADLGWMTGSSAQQVAVEGTIPPIALPSFADVADRVMPAVVSITSTEIISPSDQRGRGVNPFDFFFPQPGQRRPGVPEEDFPRPSGGSGFIISPDGYIITNNHVVERASKIEVHFANGNRTASAEVIGRDPATDLALLKINVEDSLPTVRLGDSERLRVGDWAIAIGNPHQFENTLTVGVISATGRSLGLSDATRSFENFIQTDAAINQGNSGGPLLNLRGEVIGINTAIYATGQNIGFAVPVNIAKKIYPQLKERGRVVRGYLGINIDEIDQGYQEAFGLPNADGVLVQSVSPDSPAAAAGLRRGDVVIRVDDVVVKRSRDLIDYVSDQPPGTRVRVEVIRNGDRRTIVVPTGERPADGVAVTRPDERENPESARSKIGISVQELTPDARRTFGIGAGVNGVLITHVRPVSPAGEAGMIDGDVIVELNGEAVRTAGDVQRIVERAQSRQYLRFYVTRTFRGQSNSSYFVVRVP